MSVNVIIFDFDGTIADTFDAIVNITNGLAVDFGYQKITAEELAVLRNLNYREVIKQSRVSILKLPFLVNKVKSELKSQVPHLSPIIGIPDALTELKNHGYELAIITSNSQENVLEFLQINNLENIFTYIYTGAKIFGKTRTINKFIRKHQLQPQQVVYVGDETRDIEAAKRANVKVIAVTWGFNYKEILAAQQPDFLIDQPSQILDVLSR